MGVIRPREDVSAIDINAFLSRPEGAPPTVGRIADPDKIDIARFLNRHVIPSAFLHSSVQMLIFFAACSPLCPTFVSEYRLLLCIGYKSRVRAGSTSRTWFRTAGIKLCAIMCRHHGRHAICSVKYR